jgi:hypothetical protein
MLIFPAIVAPLQLFGEACPLLKDNLKSEALEAPIGHYEITSDRLSAAQAHLHQAQK